MRTVFAAALAAVGIVGCTMPQREGASGDAEYQAGTDVFEYAAQHPNGESYRVFPDGTRRASRYGDFCVDDAEAALADLPRPLTLAAVERAYRGTAVGARRAHFLTLMAVTRTDRAAIYLGEALQDDDLDVRVAATYGLVDYYLEFVSMGGTESAMVDAEEWWQQNEATLRRRVSQDG